MSNSHHGLPNQAGKGGAWAIILAAGDGSRVEQFITAHGGRGLPKQYWAPGGRETMLEWALARAARLVPPERIAVVVAAHHRRHWQPLLAPRLPPENILVQPNNRGTAAGILLPALHILGKDPMARGFFLPSDHYFEREDLLHETFEQAGFEVTVSPQNLVLLGMALREVVPGYGWLSCGPPEASGLCPVHHFVEKPEPAVATRLVAAGALANSFVFAADLGMLVCLMEHALPELVHQFTAFWADGGFEDPHRLEDFYASVPTFDFSHHVLSAVADRLRVLPVPECGWSDLGDPARIRRYQLGLVNAQDSITSRSLPYDGTQEGQAWRGVEWV